ncbi:MAG: antitoxin VapB family protein [archaeon]
MATKTISIMEDVYNLLVRNKIKNESFSDVIRKNLTRKKNIMDFAGAWKSMNEKSFEKVKKDIKALKKRSTKELIKNQR